MAEPDDSAHDGTVKESQNAPEPTSPAWDPVPSSATGENPTAEPSKPPLSEQESALVEGIAGLLKLIEPWKIIMPMNISMQMERLKQQTSALEKKDEDSDSEDEDDRPRWDPAVKRMTMQDWAKNIDDDFDWDDKNSTPSPIMKAYFRDSKQLQRVQIDSWLLLEELEKATSVGGLEDEPVFIASPFKLLVSFMPQVDVRLTELGSELEEANAKLHNEETKAPAASDGPESKADAEGAVKEKKASIKEATENRDGISRRLNHLKCYRDFVRGSDLADIHQLREQAAEGTLKKVTFQDLWHIFRSGDILFSKREGVEQLSQLYSVTGGHYLRRKVHHELEGQIGMYMSSRPRRRHDQDSSDDEEDDQHTVLTSGIWTPFIIDAFVMGFDGTKIGPLRERHLIRYFEGERSIADLEIFPVHFHSEADVVLERMRQRGERLLRVDGHRSYQGPARPMFSGPGTGSNIQSDVFIDTATYYRDHAYKKPSLGARYLPRSQVLDIEQEEEVPGQRMRDLHGGFVDSKIAEDFFTGHIDYLQPIPASEALKSPERLRLLPDTVIGYAFRTRQWYRLNVDLIKDIDDSEEARSKAWKDLIISDKSREILVALVNTHSSHPEPAPGQQGQTHRSPDQDGGSRSQIDLIRGKGEGLIILLHGPPGSGKTSTAETIAVYTNRPLYSLTCGDIGTSPSEVESNLNDHLERAGKWGCVLLLDEADVFLQRRDFTDMQRNALVSVFLRILEYYSGILFLTTNRPGVIDEAFKSRIHIVMGYPSISLDSTKQMWNNILNNLERLNKTSDVKVVFDRDVLIRYAESHYKQQESKAKRWNGRQIRNAFQSALALGNYERVQQRQKAPEGDRGKKKFKTIKLSKSNFKKIADTAREFEDYMSDLRGEDFYLAKQEEFRNDEFESVQDVYAVSTAGTPARATTTLATRRKNQSSLAKRRAGSTPTVESPAEDKKPSSRQPSTPSRPRATGGAKMRQQTEEDGDSDDEDLDEEDFPSGDDDEDDEEEEET